MSGADALVIFLELVANPNTAAVIQIDAPPRNLAEIVAYHGRAC